MEAAVHLEACAIEEHDLAQKAAYREASDHNFEKAKKVISPNAEVSGGEPLTHNKTKADTRHPLD